MSTRFCARLSTGPWLSCRASGDIVNHSNLSMWRTTSSFAVSCLKVWCCGWRHPHPDHMVYSSEHCVKNPACSLTAGLAISTKAWLCFNMACLKSHDRAMSFPSPYKHCSFIQVLNYLLLKIINFQATIWNARHCQVIVGLCTLFIG